MKDEDDFEEEILRTSPQSSNRLLTVVLMWASILLCGFALLNWYLMS